jgi:hypothetical protein
MRWAASHVGFSAVKMIAPQDLGNQLVSRDLARLIGSGGIVAVGAERRRPAHPSLADPSRSSTRLLSAT